METISRSKTAYIGGVFRKITVRPPPAEMANANFLENDLIGFD
jgi:hypothetical protein